MLFKMTELKYRPNPVLERALDVLFILHADHEQNCSTTAMRDIGSSHVDPYSAIAGAAAALWGPLHGGANEAVLRMLEEIGTHQERAGVHRARKGGRRPADGLRPPRLQVVRPAREDHQADRRRGLRGDGQESRCSTSRSSSSGSRCRTNTSSPASSTRTSTSIRASSTRRWAFRRTSSRCCLPFRARRDGSRTGRSCCAIPSRRSRGPRQIYVGPSERDFRAAGETVRHGSRLKAQGSGSHCARRCSLRSARAPVCVRRRRRAASGRTPSRHPQPLRRHGHLRRRAGLRASAPDGELRAAAGGVAGHRADARVHHRPAEGARHRRRRRRRSTRRRRSGGFTWSI